MTFSHFMSLNTKNILKKSMTVPFYLVGIEPSPSAKLNWALPQLAFISRVWMECGCPFSNFLLFHLPTDTRFTWNPRKMTTLRELITKWIVHVNRSRRSPSPKFQVRPPHHPLHHCPEGLEHPQLWLLAVESRQLAHQPTNTGVDQRPRFEPPPQPRPPSWRGLEDKPERA